MHMFKGILAILILFVQNTLAQDVPSIVRDIHPLVSTRADIERLAFVVNKKRTLGSSETYNTKDGELDVVYATYPCKTHGWNVTSDTVVLAKWFPKTLVKFQKESESYGPFYVLRDDSGHISHIDQGRALAFVVRSEADDLKYVKLMPVWQNSKNLRCHGFPVYDPIAENYYPFERFLIDKSVRWNEAAIYNFLVQTKADFETSAALFLYCKPGSEKYCRKVQTSMVHFAKKVLGKEIWRLTVKDGGYRNNIEVESFIVPLNAPSPQPRPGFGSLEKGQMVR